MIPYLSVAKWFIVDVWKRQEVMNLSFSIFDLCNWFKFFNTSIVMHRSE